MSFQITQTKINVNGKDITFTNLSINQYLADAGSFSFAWREPKNNEQDSFQQYVSFYKQHLAKQVTITVNEGETPVFTFKGFIQAISCNGDDDVAIEYNISGKGILAAIDEIPECNSYYKKNLSDIFSDVLKNADNMLQPSNSNPLFYTVQYNQTKFEFLRMLAARYGEWLFYDGQYLVLGPVFGNAQPVVIGTDILDANLSARIFKLTEKNTGFNVYQGKEIEKEGNDASGVSQDLIRNSETAGKNIYNAQQTATYSYAALTEDDAFVNSIKNVASRQLQSATSNATQLTGRSYNSKLQLGVKISVKDERNAAMGDYILVQVNHFCSSDTNYQNSFTALPAEIKMPPYTNAELYPVCQPQPAIVTDNTDDKGMGRIKVHFPWQRSGETTPWLPVMVPHAGKNKGFYFLPEKDEQVMIDFIGGNAERPFVIGSFYTENNGHGNDPDGNYIKVIGTKTGRRLEINEKRGMLKLQDFRYETDKNNGNLIAMVKSDKNMNIKLSTMKDDDNYSFLNLESNYMGLIIRKGGEDALTISLEGDDKKIHIHARGSVNITADQEISLNAANINLHASQAVNIGAGDSGKVNIKGQEIKAQANTEVNIEATTSMKMKALEMDISADVMGKFNGGAMTTITGSLVKIN